MTLGDRIASMLAESGPRPLCEIAAAVSKRKADVLHVLRADARFEKSGSTKASRWALVVPTGGTGTFTAQQIEERWTRELGIGREVARTFLHDFLEAGYVERANGNGTLVVSARGLEAALAVEAMR